MNLLKETDTGYGVRKYSQKYEQHLICNYKKIIFRRIYEESGG